jgi:hypothetical protein
MCRNIKPLFNYDPPVSEDEIRAAAVQYVRKISGLSKPSRLNEAAFEDAIDAIQSASSILLQKLQTNASPRNRIDEIDRAKVRSRQRFPIKSISAE